jgi:cytochrome c oxidase assembly factor CtaG
VVDPWQFVLDPEWLVGLTIIAVDYVVVVRHYERRGQPVSMLRRLAFTAGLLVTALALFSPIEHLALHSMLSFHLLQNVMLADWAPPLLVAGLTAAMIAAAERRRWLRAATTPALTLAVWLAVWYAVHVPAFYTYALGHRWALGVEHLAFLVAGIAFWWPVLSPGRMAHGPKLAYLLVAFFLAAPLSFILALSNKPVYGFYAHTPKLGGISALEDQQLGAITMAVEQAVILFVACSVVVMRLLDSECDPEPRLVGLQR